MKRIIIVCIFICLFYMTTLVCAEVGYMNTEIVKQGRANIITILPDVKYTDLFLELHKEIKEDENGTRYKADFSYGALYGFKSLFFSI